jgi:hypothetical protein
MRASLISAAESVQLKIHSPFTQNPGAVSTWLRDGITWLNMSVLNCGDELPYFMGEEN